MIYPEVKVKLPLIRRERLNGRCRNGTGTLLIIRLVQIFEFPERVHYARLLFLTRDWVAAWPKDRPAASRGQFPEFYVIAYK